MEALRDEQKKKKKQKKATTIRRNKKSIRSRTGRGREKETSCEVGEKWTEAELLQK